MSEEALTGGCECGAVRYRLASRPYVVHCCHCHQCQQHTGSAFVINALIETDRVELTGPALAESTVPTPSGKGQIVLRCPQCHDVIYSHYGAAGRASAFIRVGTLDDPAACPPDAHVYTASKLPWVSLPEDVPAFTQFYSGKDVEPIYGTEGKARWKALMAR
jgi:hypothetical protein